MSSEERVNTITHLIALVATLVIAWPLLHLAHQSQITNNQLQIAGTALFLLGMFLMYGSSTLYHAVAAPVHKRRLRVFDHISIYIMIAGSYSPICLTGCVLAGVIGKVIALGRFPRLSLVLYLMMGWVALPVLVPMWRNMSHEAFWCIIAEGVFYTLGSYFFHKDEEHAYYHAVWHVFIILGSATHTAALWLILAA